MSWPKIGSALGSTSITVRKTEEGMCLWGLQRGVQSILQAQDTVGEKGILCPLSVMLIAFPKHNNHPSTCSFLSHGTLLYQNLNKARSAGISS